MNISDPRAASTPGRVVGVLLAAGRGRRAGGLKQLRPWVTPSGIKPLVAASFDAVAPACDAMVVVLGHESDLVRRALGARTLRTVLADPDAPMSESIRAGLHAASAGWEGASVLLHPGDHPSVRAETLSFLLAHAASTPTRAVIPEFRGRGGHPALIPPAVVAAILQNPLDRGLRGYWEEHPATCTKLPVADPGVLSDLDRAGPTEESLAVR